MSPYYRDDGITIYCADYVDVVGELDPVDAVITDPPYNTRGVDQTGLRDRSTPMRRDFGAWDEGFDPLAFLGRVCLVTRPGGSLLAFTSDRLLSHYRDSPVWKFKASVVWKKTNPAPQLRPTYVNTTEFVVWLQKDGGPAVWNGSGYVVNVVETPVCGGVERTEHPTQKPESLMMDLITRHTNPGDLILDPFMGSGTTVAAAKRLGRRAIGIDLNERYCEIAAKRLQQSALPFVAPAQDVAAQSDLFPAGGDHE